MEKKDNMEAAERKIFMSTVTPGLVPIRRVHY